MNQVKTKQALPVFSHAQNGGPIRVAIGDILVGLDPTLSSYSAKQWLKKWINCPLIQCW